MSFFGYFKSERRPAARAIGLPLSKTWREKPMSKKPNCWKKDG
jgi:hypothetical protein